MSILTNSQRTCSACGSLVCSRDAECPTCDVCGRRGHRTCTMASTDRVYERVPPGTSGELSLVATPPVKPEDVAVKFNVSSTDHDVVLEISVPTGGERLNVRLPLTVRQAATFASELTLGAMRVERAINERAGIVFPSKNGAVLKLPAKP